jgi:hypothetical protein
MGELAAYRLDHDVEIPAAAAGLSGAVLLRMPKKLHRDAERRATRDGVSVKRCLATAIARDVGPAKDATGAKSARIAEKMVRYRVG